MFMKTSFNYSGPKDGWILPTANKILVNVTEMEDAETWKGQVKGSEECGTFLRTHHNVGCFDIANVHDSQAPPWNVCGDNGRRYRIFYYLQVSEETKSHTIYSSYQVFSCFDKYPGHCFVFTLT